MIEIDNFDLIEPMLDFHIKHVYLVWLVRRKKDGNTEAKGNNKNRTVKSYLLQSQKQWDEAKEEIRTMCKAFNCRAYICLNRKPLLNVLLELNTNVNERLRQLFNDNVTGMNGIVDSATMNATTDSKWDKMWVLDVDSKDRNYIEAIKEVIKDCHSEFIFPIRAEIPTAHGVHLITHKFDTEAYDEICSNGGIEAPEIKQDALTLLYAYLNE